MLTLTAVTQKVSKLLTINDRNGSRRRLKAPRCHTESEVLEKIELLSGTRIWSAEGGLSLIADNNGDITFDYKKNTKSSKLQTFDLTDLEVPSDAAIDDLLNGKKSTQWATSDGQRDSDKRQRRPTFDGEILPGSVLTVATRGSDGKLLLNARVQFGQGDSGHTGGGGGGGGTGNAPTAIYLSSATAPENASNFLIGTFTAEDADRDDNHTFNIVDDAGGRFYVSGNRLYAKGSLDYETQAHHELMVRATDRASNSLDKTFSINVSNVNEAPSIRFEQMVDGSQLGLFEGTRAGVVIGTVVAVDPDGQRLGLSVSGRHFEIRGTNVVTTGQPLEHSGNLQRFSVTARDNGGLTATDQFDVNVLTTDFTRYDPHLHGFDHFGAEGGKDPYRQVYNDVRRDGVGLFFRKIAAPGAAYGVPNVVTTAEHAPWPKFGEKRQYLDAMVKEASEYNDLGTNVLTAGTGIEASGNSSKNTHLLLPFADGPVNLNQSKKGIVNSVLAGPSSSSVQAGGNQDARGIVAHAGLTAEKLGKNESRKLKTVDGTLSYLRTHYGIDSSNGRFVGVSFPKNNTANISQRWIHSLRMLHTSIIAAPAAIAPYIDSDLHSERSNDEGGYRTGESRKGTTSPFEQSWLDNKGSTILLTEESGPEVSRLQATLTAMDQRSNYVTYDADLQINVAVTGEPDARLGDAINLDDASFEISLQNFDGSPVDSTYRVVMVYADSGASGDLNSDDVMNWTKVREASRLPSQSGKFVISTDGVPKAGNLQFAYFAVMRDSDFSIFNLKLSKNPGTPPVAMTSQFVAANPAAFSQRALRSIESGSTDLATRETTVENVILFNSDAEAERNLSSDGSGQRSVIRNVSLTLSGDMTHVSRGHFSLFRSENRAAVPLHLQSTAFDRVSNTTTVVLSTGLLVDGDYLLVVEAGTDIALSNANANGRFEFSFTRMFGDSDSDGDVDTRDLFGFIDAIYGDPLMLSVFDQDGDGMLFDELNDFFRNFWK